MVRDITIGQYYPAESRIHRLDPRVKIVCTLFFLISLFIQNSLLGYVVATIFLGAVIHLSKVPLKYIVKGLKPVVILLLFTVAMNLFLTRGGETLVHFWIFTITESGLRISVFMAVRLMYLVAGSSIMTFTTTPNSLTDGIEKLLEYAAECQRECENENFVPEAARKHIHPFCNRKPTHKSEPPVKS